jgi:hypothetical protein
MINIWQVREVPTYPNSFKVYPAMKYQETNDISNFFETQKDADREAERRNDNELLPVS